MMFRRLYIRTLKKCQAIARQYKGRRIRRYIKNSIKGDNLTIYYRISDAGYPKIKPPYISNENCLKNAVSQFPVSENSWVVIADNCSESTIAMIKKYIPESSIIRCQVGNGAGTFRLALSMALKMPKESFVYFLENDYLHKPNSKKILMEGLQVAPYVSLYDHPGHYEKLEGLTADVDSTLVLQTKTCYWKLAHSTTMTFATNVSSLLRSREVIERWTLTKHPYDCEMFIDLKKSDNYLITPMPSYSTHGETEFLPPMIDWESVAIS